MKRALEWTAGYPFYIQQLGKHAWNLAEASPITLTERTYLRAIAELGDGPYRSGNVARLLNRPSTATSGLRQDLIDKGLIYATEDYGHIDFSIPRFAEFMRRYMDHAQR